MNFYHLENDGQTWPTLFTSLLNLSIIHTQHLHSAWKRVWDHDSWFKKYLFYHNSQFFSFLLHNNFLRPSSVQNATPSLYIIVWSSYSSDVMKSYDYFKKATLLRLLSHTKINSEVCRFQKKYDSITPSEW